MEAILYTSRAEAYRPRSTDNRDNNLLLLETRIRLELNAEIASKLLTNRFRNRGLAPLHWPCSQRSQVRIRP